MTNLSQLIYPSTFVAHSVTDGDTTHAPDGNSVYDALSLKANLASPTFSGTVDVSSATLTLADDQISGSKINSYMGKNAIINGNFDIWQRGTSFSSVAHGTFVADRFRKLGELSPAVIDITQDTDVPTQAQSGVKSNYSLKIDVTTSTSSLGADNYVVLRQTIEGYNFRQFVGRTSTLSFWVKSVKTGVYCVAFLNSGSDRVYIAEYTIGQASTWEKKTVTLTFDYSGGTWDYATGSGLVVYFVMAAGANKQTTKDTWQNGAYLITSSQVNFLDSTDNNFWLSQVQLELGPVATDFESRPYGTELMLCQRYYEAKTVRSENGSRHIPLVTKRAAPTIAVGVGSAANVTIDGFELTHNAAADCTLTATIEL